MRIHSMCVASLMLCSVSTVHVDLSCGDHCWVFSSGSILLSRRGGVELLVLCTLSLLLVSVLVLKLCLEELEATGQSRLRVWKTFRVGNHHLGGDVEAQRRCLLQHEEGISVVQDRLGIG